MWWVLTWPFQVILTWVVSHIQYGTMSVLLPGGKVRTFGGVLEGPTAEIEFVNPMAFVKIAFGASMGLAESYMDGDWNTPDLEALLTLAAVNLDHGKEKARFLPVFEEPINRLVHALRPNSVEVAKANISHHYDIGNDFYDIWLDSVTRAYSCAIFERGDAVSQVPQDPDTTVLLSAAQVRKFERMLELADVKKGQTVLDIGCGWGGLAIYMAKTRGCHVLGITLSEEQLAGALKAAEQAGLAQQVEFRLQDFREIPAGETFDRIVSVGMYEHLGPKYRPEYFRVIKQHLAPGGHAVVHGITIRESSYEEYLRKSDFAQKYIFPGGSLASPEAFAREAQDNGLETVSSRSFGLHYAETLRRWSVNFETALPEVRALGFDERFIRMWRYYLAYCIAGFIGERVSVMQTVLRPIGK